MAIGGFFFRAVFVALVAAASSDTAALLENTCAISSEQWPAAKAIDNGFIDERADTVERRGGWCWCEPAVRFGVDMRPPVGGALLVIDGGSLHC
jgi:hypothetical protein